jgi:hypothetical protein
VESGKFFSPDYFPGAFDNFSSSAQFIIRIIMLFESAFQVAGISAIVPTGILTLKNIYHSSKDFRLPQFPKDIQIPDSLAKSGDKSFEEWYICQLPSLRYSQEGACKNIDDGGVQVGIAALSGGKVLYQEEVTLRTDIRSLMDTRSQYRKSRRYRKTRYRKPRFLNRRASIPKCKACGGCQIVNDLFTNINKS